MNGLNLVCNLSTIPGRSGHACSGSQEIGQVKSVSPYPPWCEQAAELTMFSTGATGFDKDDTMGVVLAALPARMHRCTRRICHTIIDAWLTLAFTWERIRNIWMGQNLALARLQTSLRR